MGSFVEERKKQGALLKGLAGESGRPVALLGAIGGGMELLTKEMHTHA